jgi:predicted DNA-binding protein
MGRKKSSGPGASQGSGKAVRHARIELPGEDYDRLKKAADRVRISIAAYIRQAVMERILDDERRER